jgi:hypothetical protein
MYMKLKNNILLFSVLISIFLGFFNCLFLLLSKEYTIFSLKIICIINILFSLVYLILHITYYKKDIIIKNIFRIFIIFFIIINILENVIFYFFQSLISYIYLLNIILWIIFTVITLIFLLKKSFHNMNVMLYVIFIIIQILLGSIFLFSYHINIAEVYIVILTFFSILPIIYLTSTIIYELEYKNENNKFKMVIFNYIQCISYSITCMIYILQLFGE